MQEWHAKKDVNKVGNLYRDDKIYNSECKFTKPYPYSFLH